MITNKDILVMKKRLKVDNSFIGAIIDLGLLPNDRSDEYTIDRGYITEFTSGTINTFIIDHTRKVKLSIDDIIEQGVSFYIPTLKLTYKTINKNNILDFCESIPCIDLDKISGYNLGIYSWSSDVSIGVIDHIYEDRIVIDGIDIMAKTIHMDGVEIELHKIEDSNLI